LLLRREEGRIAKAARGAMGMPTVLREGPYVFAFFASDQPEPRHIHVKRDDQGASFG
jgi:hypothetical protein